jgi:hypothetical protein
MGVVSRSLCQTVLMKNTLMNSNLFQVGYSCFRGALLYVGTRNCLLPFKVAF